MNQRKSLNMLMRHVCSMQVTLPQPIAVRFSAYKLDVRAVLLNTETRRHRVNSWLHWIFTRLFTERLVNSPFFSRPKWRCRAGELVSPSNFPYPAASQSPQFFPCLCGSVFHKLAPNRTTTGLRGGQSLPVIHGLFPGFMQTDSLQILPNHA